MITLLINKKTGELMTAEMASQNRADGYTCPGCQVTMFPMISRKGNYFGRCAAGQIHEPGCPSRKLAENKRLIQVESTDVEKIRKSILKPPQEKKPGNSGIRNPGAPRNQEEILSSIHSLKDMYELGLCDAQDFAMNASIRLSQILLNPRTVHTIMQGNDSIGPRAIVARPEYVINSKRILRFCTPAVWMEDGKERKTIKIFDLRFTDDDLFFKWRDKLFRNTSRPGGTYTVEGKYAYVLIYGEWEAIIRYQCSEFCQKLCNQKWWCTGYQHAVCIAPNRQILPLPGIRK